jgi:alpha-beta hydrolase superfamily lysophospholipase
MESFSFQASDNTQVHTYRLEPDRPKGIIHIAHGMGEHAGRYVDLMQALKQQGYAVTANDHRGHGKTAAQLGDFGTDGWAQVLSDTRQILQQQQHRHPNIPLVLLGHSMGAMLAQQYLHRWGNNLSALVLSGSPGINNLFLQWLISRIVRFEVWRLGPLRHSKLLQLLVFGQSNKAFSKTANATGFEWLSRDPVVVAKYMQDPDCGGVPFPESLGQLFAEEVACWEKPYTKLQTVSLPIYCISGGDDPVHNGLANLQRLFNVYQRAGLAVDLNIYPGGRHEMFNEINREQVISDLLIWLDQKLGSRAGSGQ